MPPQSPADTTRQIRIARSGEGDGPGAEAASRASLGTTGVTAGTGRVGSPVAGGAPESDEGGDGLPLDDPFPPDPLPEEDPGPDDDGDGEELLGGPGL